MKPSSQPGLENEPQYQQGPHLPDPTEARTDKRFSGRTSPHSSDNAAAGESVWDEPTFDPGLSGAVPEDAVTWERHLRAKQAATTAEQSLLTTLGVALAAAPFAVIGAFYYGHATAFAVVAAVFFAPLLEEVLKVTVCAWVVEARPWLFKHGSQIILCGLAAGFFFGVIENLLYLNVYIPNPSTELIIWRWTVCTALHMTCSCLAAIGLYKVWKKSVRTGTRVPLTAAAPWMLVAIILHAAYNALAILVFESYIGGE
ncbi:MAG: PrsW family intramembrane metalloprotease [Candidatus Sumerlaeia bacterium]|nr:PrsW family intramembrane metalloprotease [Candidatus Sumerlaeia bacterium]